MTEEAQPSLTLAGLTVTFPEFRLGPLSLEARPGQVLAVVGPNGSGKTTLLRAICGLQAPTAGTVNVAGLTPTGRPDELLNRVGYIPDDYTELLADLTARELWDLHIHAHRRRGRDKEELEARVIKTAERFDFRPPSGTIGSYSHGGAKKTQLVAGLMHNPPVVIFDEPHNGLDPIAIRELDGFIAELAVAGAGIVLATHNLTYAERVADQVLMLRGGQVLAFGSPAEIIGSARSLEDAFFGLLDAAR